MVPLSPVAHAVCLARSSSTSAACGSKGTATGVRQSLESIPGFGTVLADSIEDIWAELVDLRELVGRLTPPASANAIHNVAVVSGRNKSSPAVSAASAELRAVLDKRRARAEGAIPPIRNIDLQAAVFSFAEVDKNETMEPECFSICDDEPGESAREGCAAKMVVHKMKSKVSIGCSELREPPVPRRPVLSARELAKSVNEALLATNDKIAGYQRDCSAQCSAIASNSKELEEQIGGIGNDLARLKTDIKIHLHTIARKCLDDQTRLGREMTEQIQAMVETVESLDRTVSSLRVSVNQNSEQLAATSTRLDDSSEGLSNCDRRLCELEDRCVSVEQVIVSPGLSNIEDVHSVFMDLNAAAEQNSRLTHSLNGALQSLQTALCDAADSAPSTKVLSPTDLPLLEKTHANTMHPDKCQ
mmetsp:Transcript_58841/g.116562  ORF Transcript_58841/g.116562 Transcript_58841/m.116562 type:complete len:416 (-) Transcript_58841:80-1327(-)